MRNKTNGYSDLALLVILTVAALLGLLTAAAGPGAKIDGSVRSTASIQPCNSGSNGLALTGGPDCWRRFV